MSVTGADMTDMNRLLTVVVPVYKVEQYLDKCVQSVADQSYSNLEIILVDDGSPDNCPEMCDDWASKDERIKVIHRNNGGLSAARNDGIRAAHGEYLMFLDSDDYFEPGTCERFMSYVSDEDFIVGDCRTHRNGRVSESRHDLLEEDHVYTGAECARLEISEAKWYAAACLKMYNVSFLRKNDLYFCEGLLHEDMEFQPRVYLAAGKVKYLKFAFYNYVLRGDSITGSISSKHFDDLMKIYSGWYKQIETIPDKKIRKAFAGALSKHFMHTCRVHKITERIYPEGMTSGYIIRNALSFKDFVKSVIFAMSRKIYIKL